MNQVEDLKSANPQKAPRRDTPATVFKNPPSQQSNIRLVVAVALSVFLCETFVMIALRPLVRIYPWLAAFLDAFILVLILSPVLYLFVFRPMVRHITERELAEKALRESETRFRTVFHTSPDSITISRLEDGRIFDVNEGFTLLTGYSREQVLGISALDIPLWNDARVREEMVAALQKDGRVNNVEAKFKHHDGRLIDGLISSRVITLNEELHVLAVARDIGKLKQTENTLRASQNFLQISNRHREMDSLLKEFIAQIKSLTECSAVGIRILDENGNIPYQAHEGFSPEFYESENPLTIDRIRCMCAEVIRGRLKIKQRLLTKGGSLYIGSSSRFMATLSEAEKGRFCDVCSKYGYESVALIPIPLADKILGLIHLAGTHKNQFSLETLEILEGAAMQLGPAIERVRIEEALKEYRRELEDRVKDRTARLVEANELLNLEIQERRQTEKELIANQDKLRMLSAELLLTEERERRHIATELHDRIGQTLAVSKIKLGGLREEAPSPEFAEALNEIRRYIEQTIRDTRSLTFELSPPTLYELGLESALQSLVEQIHENYGLRIDFSDDQQPKPLDASCRVVAYMAVRELLFNVIKHAGARSIRLAVERAEDTLRIHIADDGAGFNLSDVSSRPGSVRGFGLHSIRERMEPLRGQLVIDSQPGGGTRVTLVLPLNCQISTEDNQ